MSDYVFLDPNYDDGAHRMHASDSEILEVDFFNLVADFWRPGTERDSGDIIRPRKATGFAYQAGSDGQTGNREPSWPTTLAGTVTDGSITWTAVAAGSNGVDDVSSPSVSISPSSELAATSVSVVNETRVQMTLSGGTEGGGNEVTMPNGCVVTGYVVSVTVTLDSGETRVGSVVVVVDPR